MKIKKFFYVILCFILFLCPMHVLAADENFISDRTKSSKVVVGIDVNVPPMGFIDHSGNMVGFDIDLANVVFKNLGMDVSFQVIDWDSKELELNTGKVDVIWNGLSWTPEREKSMLLSNPYMKNRQVVIVKNSSSIVSLDDLKGKEIVVQKGSTAESAVRNHRIGTNAKNVIALESMLNCLNEVDTQKSDATVLDEVVAKYYFSNIQKQSDFRIIDEEVSTEFYTVAVKKDNTELMEKINYQLSVLNDSREGEEISQKWFGENLFYQKINADESAVEENKSATSEPSVVFMLTEGLSESMKLFLIVIVLSLPLGLLLCVAQRLKWKPLEWLIIFYTNLMKGTPLLLQLFFIFYGLPHIPVVGPYLTIKDRFVAGVIAFVINYAAYFSEIFRGGFNAIDKGQYEAAYVLGLSNRKTLFKVILPQVIKICLPSIGNEFVTLVKDTALVFAIGVTELLATAKNIVNRDANISAYVIAAVFYFVICFIISMLFRALEKKLSFE